MLSALKVFNVVNDPQKTPKQFDPHLQEAHNDWRKNTQQHGSTSSFVTVTEMSVFGGAPLFGLLDWLCAL
ncbi:hypothetical protein NECAME_08619 [Necator americanus]|uniref:Uncharacterized protein n=1 Tax=Necator americanus TaxID=51031 RepID=W2TGV3_NECAM|nr:hypothetical protein NECAME_08619 [Necator americanus]ETN81260.1 hypothetical protein NECAME_08619 [Necator americanus]